MTRKNASDSPKPPAIDLSRAEFLCCLAPTSGAVNHHGDCGTEIKIHVDESFIAEMFKVATMKHKQLRCVLTVEGT